MENDKQKLKMEKIDALLRIADLHRREFISRRNIEWRILFTVLTFIVLLIISIYQLDLDITIAMYNGAMILFGTLIILIGFNLFFIHRAHNMNKKFAQRAERSVLDILKNQENELDIINPKPKWPNGVDWFVLISQILIVIVFALSALSIIHNKKNESITNKNSAPTGLSK